MKWIFTEGREVRPGPQQEALEALAKPDAKYILLCAPVGSGKSEIGMAFARGAETAFVVTHQNVLLDQYVASFGIPMVKGRRHYNCRWAHMNCDDASEMYEGQHAAHCEDYVPTRDFFWGSTISLTNLHYACFAHRPEGAICHRNLLVVDECHGLEPMLLDLYKTHLRSEDVRKLGVNYQQSIQEVLHDFLVQVEAMQADPLHRLVPDIKQRKRINSVARRIASIDLDDASNPWFTDKTDEGIHLRPLFARNLSQKLLRMADRVLFMSATPGSSEHFFANLGIPAGETSYVEVESNFPRGKGITLANLPGKPAPYVTSRKLANVLPDLVEIMRVIFRGMATEKGLVACASYQLAYELAKHLTPEFGRRIITHDSKTRDSAVKRHRASTEASILFAVNMHKDWIWRTLWRGSW